MVPSLSLQRVVQKRDRNLAADPALPQLDFLDRNPRYYALPKEIGPQPDSVVRPTVNRSGVRELTAGLDQSAAWSRREPLRNPRWGATDHEDICRIQQPRTLPLQK
jgi:hypothetical protein